MTDQAALRALRSPNPAQDQAVLHVPAHHSADCRWVALLALRRRSQEPEDPRRCPRLH